MEHNDIVYLCTTIGNLAGIPLRVYKDNTRIFYRALVDLPKDPMLLFQKEIWNVTAHVGYFATPFFDYYGIVNAPPYKLILGPTRQVKATDSELKALAFQADIDAKDIDRFITAMKNIIRMPLDSILQILCTVNFVWNHEQVSNKDIVIVEPEDSLIRSRYDQQEEAGFNTPPDDDDYEYTGYAVEQQLMDIVAQGDSAALQNWLSSAPAVRPGVLSDNYLRQMKNIMIVSTTLASRAAIRGGLDTQTAFHLSDEYVRRCELLQQPEQIVNLQYNMIADYTERVRRIRAGNNPSLLSLRVANYVQNHLSDVITVDDLTKELLLSRSRLTAVFKIETGMTLMDFVMKTKIEEAKRLLRYTDKSLSAISDYLGFSSQSHFSRMFKKWTGRTPGCFEEEKSC